ncbi:MAG TPA: serine hydrolase domain-containing protein [Rhizomicrobium sp.]
MHRRNFLALSGSALVASNGLARESVDAVWARDFDGFVNNRLAVTHTPGLSVAMVRGGRTVFSRGYGYASIETARRVTADAVFQIASLSKTVTATALMMLWQDGAFKLDDPITAHAGFSVMHPKFPDVPITFRHLFTHTSGISDTLYDTLDFSTAPIQPLPDFLASYLSPGGRLYESAKCYSAMKPGTQWSYSNVAVALLGYLAGRVGRIPLETLTQNRLFGPLGLRNTAWRYEGIADERLALPYSFENARYRRLPRNAYPDWPAGLLCTSANDFAKILAVYTQDGGGFLKPQTVATMLTPDPVVIDAAHPQLRQGLIWRLRDWNGDHLASHPGGDPGTAIIAAFDADRHCGALAFANAYGGSDFALFQKEVMTRLLDKAGSA